MKQIIKQLANIGTDKHFIPLMALCFFSAVIWFGGPFIVIAHTTPLAELDKRCYIILLLFTAWLLKIHFFTPITTTTTTTPNAVLAKKLRLLESRFQGAMHFLKKNFINKDDRDTSLYQLPWYLLMGPTGSGKTTLLANANINFILAKQFKNEVVTPSDSCDWWVTRDLVLLDVPGAYTHSKHKSLPQTAGHAEQPLLLHQALWQHFLTLLKKYRGKQAIAGIIIAFSLPELILQQQQQKESVVLELKKSLQDLKDKFGAELPCYLVITKCDLLPGFYDFFSDSSSDELAQAWGVTLPPQTTDQQLLSAFANRFNALIKRLNKQLIWRLHQARNPLTRPQIKDFPLQLERVKKHILGLLKTLSTESSFHLHGVYLTSATQPATEKEQSATLCASTTEQVPQLICNPAMPSRAHFVRQLLLQAFPSTTPFALPSVPTWRWSTVAYASALGLLIISASLFGETIRYGMKQTYAAVRYRVMAYPNGIQHAKQKVLALARSLPLFQQTPRKT